MTSSRESIIKLSDLDLRIETARLVLRPLRESDVDDLWPYVSDPGFPKMMSWAAHVDKEDTRSFVRAVTEATAKQSWRDVGHRAGGSRRRCDRARRDSLAYSRVASTAPRSATGWRPSDDRGS
jgi:RimJ/RimL family protein N-acetyltransferase